MWTFLLRQASARKPESFIPFLRGVTYLVAMKNLRNMKDSVAGTLICGAQILLPAVITAVNLFVLR